jgi:hypothetical protein
LKKRRAHIASFLLTVFTVILINSLNYQETQQTELAEEITVISKYQNNGHVPGSPVRTHNEENSIFRVLGDISMHFHEDVHANLIHTNYLKACEDIARIEAARKIHKQVRQYRI